MEHRCLFAQDLSGKKEGDYSVEAEICGVALKTLCSYESQIMSLKLELSSLHQLGFGCKTQQA